MKESFSTEQSPNPDKPNFELVTVTTENILDLENIRREVDGEKNIVPEKFVDELNYYESGGEHTAFLIRDSEKVIGYIEVDLKEEHIPKGADRELCKELQGHAHIARIGLLPEYRGRSIGNTLLGHAEDWARTHGQTVIWLDYLPEKEPLVEFYEAAGYQTFTEFPDGAKNRLRRISVKKL
jgi:ribosomal protein S18 acetylase RimI-like enzyme